MKDFTRRTFVKHTALTAGALALPPLTFGGIPMDLSGGIDPAREFVLAERPDTEGMRDAVNVWIEEEHGAFAMRIGVEALAEEWDNQLVWLDIAFPDGRVLNLRDQAGPTHAALDKAGKPTIRGSGGVRFQMLKPFEQWSVNYQGDMPETTAMDLIKEVWPDQPPMTAVEFDITMNMAVPPWAPGSMLKSASELVKGEQGQFISPRYEQLFRCDGSMKVGDKHYDFAGNGLRIRRQGIRKFEGFWGHCWQSAVFPSGKGFGFNTFPPRDDGKPSYNEGYIFTGEGVMIPARAVHIPWLTELKTHGEDVSCVLETDQGTVEIKGVTFINCRSRAPGVALPESFPIVQQSHAHYSWDGEETVGMIERSSLPGIITNL